MNIAPSSFRQLERLVRAHEYLSFLIYLYQKIQDYNFQYYLNNNNNANIRMTAKDDASRIPKQQKVCQANFAM